MSTLLKIAILLHLLVKISHAEFEGYLSSGLGTDTRSLAERETYMTFTEGCFFFIRKACLERQL